MIGRACCLELEKGRHRYIFRYRQGQEGLVLSALVELADRADCDFDWFDAALLGHQLGAAEESEAKLAAR